MLTVFLADDEQNIIDGVKNLFDWKSRGIEIVGEANDGNDAFYQIVKIKPDIILTDMRMPGKNGIELIKALQNERIESEFLVISAHEDFNYCLEALRLGVYDYLLKPVNFDALAEKIDLIIEKILTKNQGIEEKKEYSSLQKKLEYIRIKEFIDEILRGEKTDEWIWQNSRELFIAEYFFIVGVISPTQHVEWGEWNDILSHVVEESFEIHGEKNGFLCIVNTDNVITLIMGYNEERDIKNKANRILSSIINDRNNDESKVTIGTGSACRVNRLKNSWTDAQFALEKGMLYRGYGRCYNIGEFTYSKAINNYSWSTINIDMLVSLIEDINLKEAESVLDYIFSEFYEKQVSVKIIDKVLNQICVLMQNLLHKTIENEQDKINYSIEYFTLDHCKTLDEYKEYMMNILREVVSKIDEINNKKQLSQIFLINKYLTEHYNQDIDLNVMAEQFHMNPYYFSRFFKKKMGINYIDYLNGLRIKGAKRLLNETELSISEIASQVGFSDYRYFTKVFKKYMQVTPQQFRNS